MPSVLHVSIPGNWFRNVFVKLMDGLKIMLSPKYTIFELGCKEGFHCK